MAPHRLRRSLGLKLALAFAGVLAVMLGSLAVVLVESGRSDAAYKSALSWRRAIDGAARQASGTRQQQAAQALYVATFDPRYKREWEAGVTLGDQGAEEVQALHDPVVTRIAAGAAAAAPRPAGAVHPRLLPRAR